MQKKIFISTIILISIFTLSFIIYNGYKLALKFDTPNSIQDKKDNASDADNINNDNLNAPEDNQNTTAPEEETPSPLPKQEEITSTSNNSKEETSPNQASTFTLKKLGNLEYYLYTPNNPQNDMPLIIYLHGGTNKKGPISALLTTDGFPKYLYEGYYQNLNAYVAIPKLDNKYTGWADIYKDIRNLIKDLSTEYNIGINKVSLTGHSLGGTGTFQLQTKLSNTFACIAPLSGSIKNTTENIKSLSQTKIWAFVGTADTIVSPDSTIEIVNELQKNNVNAKLTKLDNATHFDVPALAYKNTELINWLANCEK